MSRRPLLNLSDNVQEKLVKLVSVKALVNVEDGEHLELVGSVSDVHIYLRGHCRKARFFNSLLWKRHVDTIEMRIVLQLPVSLNSLELTFLALFTTASSATFLGWCTRHTALGELASTALILK